jgi:hypothetical protein
LFFHKFSFLWAPFLVGFINHFRLISFIPQGHIPIQLLKVSTPCSVICVISQFQIGTSFISGLFYESFQVYFISWHIDSRINNHLMKLIIRFSFFLCKVCTIMCNLFKFFVWLNRTCIISLTFRWFKLFTICTLCCLQFVCSNTSLTSYCTMLLFLPTACMVLFNTPNVLLHIVYSARSIISQLPSHLIYY